jgi:hypothetical protein
MKSRYGRVGKEPDAISVVVMPVRVVTQVDLGSAEFPCTPPESHPSRYVNATVDPIWSDVRGAH